MSLKSFIKSVRNSKTIAAERAAIRKESAKIRTAFRDVHLDNDARSSNISKLLYLYILGEPTYFGQVECLKLLASPKFANKRLGYLATMLILDENQEVLTLLTNSLDNDMKSTNQYIAGLALVTLGNIASPELARDLYSNVNTLLQSQHSYLRKKAAIVAAKLVDKDPDLSEIFLPRVAPLLSEKSHGVVLGALQLMRSIYNNDESSRETLKGQIPRVLSHLRLLTSTGHSPEYDVKGVPDPFLFVSLLHTLRLLLANDDHNPNLEPLNDLLTQVCSRIDSAKGSGYSVLYETVQTIFMVNSDSSLKVLGINILSKFLTQKDNNTRYVALNTLLNVMNYEPLAVQRHRATIVGCLQDGDISIRRRALELTFAIMNQQNVRILTKTLLDFLQTADDELKEYITTQLCIACNKYRPDLKWHFETLISLLKTAGNHFSKDILSSILALVMQNTDAELTRFLVVELISSSQSAYNEFALALVTTWCIGEYADLVLGQTHGEKTITEESLVNLIETYLSISTFDQADFTQMKVYALTALLKLSAKLNSATCIERLRKLLISFQSDLNLEIQTRAIEYSEIFGQPASIKRALLERMPPPPVKLHEGIPLVNRAAASKSAKTSGNQPATSGDLLLDLLGDDDQPVAAAATSASTSSKPQESTLDLLSDIFGSAPALTEQPQHQTAEVLPTREPVPETIVPAFKDENVSFDIVVKQIGQGSANLEGRVSNVGATEITNITVLCAVTKQQKLQLSQIGNNTLAPGATSSLGIKITGGVGAKVKIRVKLDYTGTERGFKVLDQFEQQFKLPRSYAVLGGGGFYLLLVFLNFGGIGQLLSNLAGFAYPGYLSLKALKTSTSTDDTRLLTYWVVFAALNVVEFWSKAILYWIPSYFLIKTLFLLYLSVPSYNGAELVYSRVLRPLTDRYIGAQDPAAELLNKVHEKAN
ncbi:hypothetical protein OGAPHI_006200 [Ogataea philodendri]|uniref:AP-1 complex subunit gamma n=1 Tax=Ogataea philodendri TaxID=1378263 RepID=A0A9P8NYX1_9ASCO|nr:uncharacterized protein OGAPHI_006200 [Ogataea philodendri]KAH3662019.1 hypothetical protein OGAPHI_006200 [Ogataea philodendri]